MKVFFFLNSAKCKCQLCVLGVTIFVIILNFHNCRQSIVTPLMSRQENIKIY